MFNFDFLEKRLGIVSASLIVYDFPEKYFACYILLTDQISLSDCFYFLRYWAICVCNCLFHIAICHVINFEINQPCLSNQVVFPCDQKVKTKIYIS